MPAALHSEWVNLFVIFLAAAIGRWAETTGWGARLSGAAIAMSVTFGLASLGVIPVRHPIYDAVWTYMVPLAIPLLLFQANLPRMARESGRTLIAFGCGGIGTAVGTMVAFSTLELGEEGWKIASALCATYIGGSMNFASTAQAVGLMPGDQLLAAGAADSVIAIAYFILLFSLPSMTIMRRWFAPQELGVPKAAGVDPMPKPSLSPRSVLSSLAAAAAVCAVGFESASQLGLPDGGIIFVTALSLAVATAFPQASTRLRSSEELGTLLMFLFFAALGATADIAAVLRVGGRFVGFAAIIVAVHLVFTLLAGWVLRLRLSEILLASNACIGGPTTAAAMAVACRWRSLVGPAVLCGTMGYAMATFVGVGIGSWLR